MNTTFKPQRIDKARLLESLMEDRVFCRTTEHIIFYIEAAKGKNNELEFTLRFPSGRTCSFEEYDDLIASIGGFEYIEIDY